MIEQEIRPGEAGQVEVKPIDLKEQVPWEDAKAVAILVHNGAGKINQVFLSSITIEELAILSKQLDAHLTYLMGPMKEGF